MDSDKGIIGDYLPTLKIDKRKTILKDPLKALQREGEKLKGLSRAEIRKRAYELALKEAK